MSVASPQRSSATFRQARQARYTGAAVAPLPLRSPAPQPGKSAQRLRAVRVQNRALAIMILGAFGFIGAGLAYLTGYANVTREAYRRAHLRRELYRERALTQDLIQQEAIASTPEHIESRVRALQMMPADETRSLVIK